SARNYSHLGNVLDIEAIFIARMKSRITNPRHRDLKIGGDFKLFKALHIGGEVNVGEAVKGIINTAGMVTTAAQNYIQEKINSK
ncbi:hypothetical protein, partial [Elizabethkingia anophelis]|uniref:hypothetical protein n=1 Tax=Elizabethkingia anophelis TaxID=1117645 RepID=UPI003892AFD4